MSMQPPLRTFAAVLLALILGACSLGGDQMQPGEWEITGWLENASAPGVKIDEQVHTTKLTSQAAGMLPVSAVIFGQFYRGSSPENITANRGEISGTLSQSAIAPFPDGTNQVVGQYTSENFRVVIDLGVLPGAKQVVEGRLIEPEN